MISPYASASFTARYNFISSAMFWLCFVGWRRNKNCSKGRKRRKKIVEIFVRIKKYCFNKKRLRWTMFASSSKSFQAEIEFVCELLKKSCWSGNSSATPTWSISSPVMPIWELAEHIHYSFFVSAIHFIGKLSKQPRKWIHRIFFDRFNGRKYCMEYLLK